MFTNFKTIQIVIKIFEINVLIVKSSSRSTWISNDLINAEIWPNKLRCLSIPNFFLIIRIYTGLVLYRRLLTIIKKKMINFGRIISKMLRLQTGTIVPAWAGIDVTQDLVGNRLPRIGYQFFDWGWCTKLRNLRLLFVKVYQIYEFNRKVRFK